MCRFKKKDMIIKRIICLLLAFVMLLSVVSCGVPNDDKSNTETEENTEHYDGVFQIGYARADISPEKPGLSAVSPDLSTAAGNTSERVWA